MEYWLKCNRRAIYAGLLVPIFFLAIGSYLLIRGVATESRWFFPIFGAVLACFGGWMAFHLIRQLRIPRIGYQDGGLFVNLRSGAPIRLPVEMVECFFSGQGPSQIGMGVVEDAETSNVVVRLAERATEWHQVEIKPALGHWCDGYITIHGAWCERIDASSMENLNARLAHVRRILRDSSEEAPIG